MTSVLYKVKYLEAYIHFRKNKFVKIKAPVNQQEDYLLNHCFTIAKHYMNSIGKSLNVQ